MTHPFESYQSPFSWRYGTPEMRRVFSEKHKYELWRKIWVALATVEKEAGLVSSEELEDLIKHQSEIDIDRILELETETKHDVVAAIKEYAEKTKIGGGKIHFGATSMDIVDNAEMIRMQEGLDCIQEKLTIMLTSFAHQMERMADIPCMGYTHLQPAEPTTVGYRLAFYAQDLLIDFESLQSIKRTIKGKGMKGAVGTRASYHEILKGTAIDVDELDLSVMQKIGIESSLIATQVYTRKYDYLVASLLASISSSVSKFAGDLRILQSPAFGEWSEPFGKKQVGSSAMPFKKNPISSEKICSLARYVAQLPHVLLENASLSYLERTLDDSANRRIALSEGFLAVDEILLTAEKIISGLVFHTERIKFNLYQYGPFSATEVILITLVKKGADRQEIHELLRTIAMSAWQDVQKGIQNPMEKLLSQDKKIKKYLNPEEITNLLGVSNHIGDAPKRTRDLVKKIKEIV